MEIMEVRQCIIKNVDDLCFYTTIYYRIILFSIYTHQIAKVFARFSCQMMNF